MAARAYVMIETGLGQSGVIADTLRSIPDVTSVDVVTGPHDIIAVISTQDADSLGRLLRDRIQAVEGIERTLTCVVFGAGS